MTRYECGDRERVNILYRSSTVLLHHSGTTGRGLVLGTQVCQSKRDLRGTSIQQRRDQSTKCDEDSTRGARETDIGAVKGF
jgi:hypothetical protein